MPLIGSIGPVIWAIDRTHAQYVTDHHIHRSLSNGREVKRLARSLGLPDWVELKYKKGRIEGHMALAILLNWLAFPTRQDTEMPDLFNRPRRTLQV